MIGSGPGGQRAAIQAAKAGKRVVLIEKQLAVGGVCINTSTIPSTTTREAILHLSGFYDKTFHGATPSNGSRAIPIAALTFPVAPLAT